MSEMVQIRNVPDALHRKLKTRAADLGQTLSDYLLAKLERLAARPTRDEVSAFLRDRHFVSVIQLLATSTWLLVRLPCVLESDDNLSQYRIDDSSLRFEPNMPYRDELADL